MKPIIKKYFIYSLLSVSPVAAHSHVLQIFEGRSYNAVDLTEIESISFDVDNQLMIINNPDGEIKNFNYWIGLKHKIGETVPLIEINTDVYQEEITSKTDYSDATFTLRCFGKDEDIERKVSIKGRGNSSWGFPKKPYRLKFDKKTSLCGLPAAKNFVLLANYMDCSLIQNALAFKIGELLDLPFTNVGVPVDVVLNGSYKGSYLLTNKPGINAGNVNIDEGNSIMWELDVAFDEELKFRSPVFDLPVMVADPDLDEAGFDYWKADFIEMEKAVDEGNASDYVDLEEAAKYLVVYEILKNDELGYPKSFKLYKTKGSKYNLGPIWDFDVAMGKVWLGECYTQENIGDPIWKNPLINRLNEDSEFKKAFAVHLGNIIEKVPELLAFIDNYASDIENSALRNQSIYPEYEDFRESVRKLKDWLLARSEALKLLYHIDID